jgi:hypothetical protein
MSFAASRIAIERRFVKIFTRSDLDRSLIEPAGRTRGAKPDFARLDRSRIHTGDILLFTRVDPRQPTGEELLIGHAAVAIHLGGELYMMHATRDYVWRPTAGRDSPPIATGIYYGDPRREQLGVALATAWVADPRGQELRKDGVTYHGYHRTQLRAVHDYMAGARFHGVMVIRPMDRPARRAVIRDVATTPHPPMLP